ncbi:MAG: hypothetical protein M1816_002078 [Peltula sp. TS41687]|nr:MAG: hypothetical protein M1816_002078 [Peltula sp. TS41687]
MVQSLLEIFQAGRLAPERTSLVRTKSTPGGEVLIRLSRLFLTMDVDRLTKEEKFKGSRVEQSMQSCVECQEWFGNSGATWNGRIKSMFAEIGRGGWSTTAQSFFSRHDLKRHAPERRIELKEDGRDAYPQGRFGPYRRPLQERTKIPIT